MTLEKLMELDASLPIGHVIGGRWAAEGKFIVLRTDPDALIGYSPTEDIECPTEEIAQSLAALRNAMPVVLAFVSALKSEFTPTERGLSPQWTHINTVRHMDTLTASLSEIEVNK